MPDDREPLAVIQDGVCYYHEAAVAVGDYDPPDDPEYHPSPTRHEGRIEIYDDWVRLGGTPIAGWHPREAIEQIHER